MTSQWMDFLFSWAHILFGIAWIGLLYYFNFVQTEYFKEAQEDARKDAVQKLVPRALWYFRWAALLTFLTGLALLDVLMSRNGLNVGILLGGLMGTIMMLNVWMVIWPNQKIVIAGAEGAKEAGPRAALASRTNTLLSLPMLLLMVLSTHMPVASQLLATKAAGSISFCVGMAVILLIEANAIFGKPGPMASVRGVMTCSIVLTGIFGYVVLCL